MIPETQGGGCHCAHHRTQMAGRMERTASGGPAIMHRMRKRLARLLTTPSACTALFLGQAPTGQPKQSMSASRQSINQSCMWEGKVVCRLVQHTFGGFFLSRKKPYMSTFGVSLTCRVAGSHRLQGSSWYVGPVLLLSL